MGLRFWRGSTCIDMPTTTATSPRFHEILLTPGHADSFEEDLENLRSDRESRYESQENPHQQKRRLWCQAWANSIHRILYVQTSLSYSTPSCRCSSASWLSLCSWLAVKANYARVKAENPDLLPKEMMAKIAEVVSFMLCFSLMVQI